MALTPALEESLAQAVALHQAGALDSAAAIYQQVLATHPQHPGALHLMGLVAHQKGQSEAGAALVRQAIALQPDNVAFHSNLTYILTVLKQLDQAVDSAHTALRLNPKDGATLLNLGNALKELGRIDESIVCFEALCKLQPDMWHAHSNLLYSLQYATGRSPGQIFEAHRAYARHFETSRLSPRMPQTAVKDPDRRLRIGYLSPDLREHPVAYYLEPVLAHHDKTQFEVTCYFDHLQVDVFTQTLRALSDHWVDCKALSDEQLAERIRSDGIDILIDLAGHTADNRLAVFARKPAPVQMTWLGYVDTTGLSAMDWRLTHVDADPPGHDQFHSERLYRFEQSLWWAYRPRAGMPTPGPAPCHQNGFVTFGSTNNIGKLNQAVLQAWAEMLRRVPTSRLVLAGIPEGSARQKILSTFAAAGVLPQRLTVLGKLDPAAFWALHAQIDLVLDPFPYNGGATTCDALWLGVPVIALQGERFVGRMGHALLKSLGLAELSAPDVAAYVRLGVRLARDPARLQQMRAGLRARVESSALRDEAGFTRELEQAFRQAWRAWCAS